MSAARTAAEADIKIFCIGIGAAEGVPIPVSGGGYIKDSNGNIVLSKTDEPTLKQIAAITGGAYVQSVAGDMDLDVLYNRYIRGTMASAALGEQQTKVFENRYQWALALAVFLLFFEFMLPVNKTAGVLILVTLAALAPRPAMATDLKEALKQGESAYTAGDYAGAADSYVAAQLEAPEKSEILYDLGNARYKAKDYGAAIQAYRQTLDTKDPALKHKALYNLGNAYFRQGDLDKAIESYKAALTLDDTDIQARENLDYVKELKTNPPPDKSQNQQDQKDQKDQKDRKDGNKEKPGDNSSDKQNGPSPDQQNENDKDSGKNESEAHPSPSQNQKKSSSPEQAESPGQPAEQKDSATPDKETLRQAEKMLNRLQDQPGRALVPAYGEQRVEKDW